MNFSTRFFVFLLAIFAMIVFEGCGVKSPPVPYPETSIDSYLQNYTGNPPSPTPSAEEKPSTTP